ncbi:MAG: hypothetical protein WDW38_005990 [Sanguina aurantia]
MNGASDASFDDALRQFLQITPIEPEQARFFLEATNGNLDMAVNMYTESVADYPHASPAPATARAPPRPYTHAPAAGAYTPPPPAAALPPPPRPRAPNQPRRPMELSVRGILGFALLLPFVAVRTSAGVLSGSVRMSIRLMCFLARALLPARAVVAAQGTARAVANGFASSNMDPVSQAAAFTANFAATYGEVHPRWVATSCKQATANAVRSLKFLMVYLHAPEHQDTDHFCSGTLCLPEVADYINDNFIAWGGDICSSDAYTLASRLHVTTFPTVALLATSPGGEGRVQLVVQVQGAVGGAELLRTLRRAVEEHGAVLVTQRMDREAQEFSRRLVGEQNAEYEASLAADRQREELRAAERQGAEAAERDRQEEEERARSSAAAAARRIADLLAAIESRRAAKRAALGPEPEASAPATTQVRIRLPDGSNHQRRFPSSCPISTLYDFVDSLDATTAWRYKLVCNYPRKVLGPELANSTLEAEGMSPQVLLFVQPEEDPLE